MNRIVTLLAAALLAGSTSHAQETLPRLEKEFADPPSSARPYVWWHWMNGNISKDGIRKDLLWMDRVGVRGLHQFDAAWKDVRQVVDRPLTYLSDEWKDAFHYALTIADSLGFEVGVASCPGFSSTGGPWVRPEDAMKKLVWRSVEADGGRMLDMDLPGQFCKVGVWQDFPRGKAYEDVPEWNADVAVVAMRIPDADMDVRRLGAAVSSSAGPAPSLDVLTDGSYVDAVTVLREPDAQYSWLQYSFPQPVTVRAFRLSIEAKREIIRGKPANYRSQLQCSDDGRVWRNICRIPDSIVPCLTMDIEPATARYFRVRFMKRPDLANGHRVREFALFTTARVNHAEAKAGFEAPHDLRMFPTPETDAPVGMSDVVDISSCVTDGHLRWQAPAGRWRIYRFGASLTGKKNHPTIKDTEGLEVDKLDPEAWSRFFHNYLDLYREAAGGMMGEHGIQYILNDSYEAGQANWTPRLSEEFRARHGYALEPWMPVLAGEIIGSSAQSERFLWDFRQTLGELFAENHDRLDGILAEYGLKGRYTESHENGHAFVGDGMDIKKGAAVPMSAFWFHNHGSGPVPSMARADLRESASVAHIYGQNLVAAESFTVSGMHGLAYTFYPEKIKPLADFAFANGLNRVVIHDSAHQPSDDAVPGTGLLRYGQWFNRHETWAEMARPWMDYLARSCFMLQQGRNVADILVYYGEDSSVTGIYGHSWPDIPEGCNFDFISPSALVSCIDVRNGRMVTASGQSYAVLVLGSNCETMSMPVLRKIASLARSGVEICGQPPLRPASLTDDRHEFDALVDEIWNGGHADMFLTRTYEHLSRAGVAADCISDGRIDYVHRLLDDGSDIYWVRNRSERDTTVSLSFRSGNICARLFNPEDGRVTPLCSRLESGRVSLSLDMGGEDAVFVVLTAGDPFVEAGVTHERRECGRFSPDGWTVLFEQGRGAPGQAKFEKLESWTENVDPGIRYYSGTALYRTVVRLSGAELRDAAGFELDLGMVKYIAEVFVNGKPVGTLWRRPWVVTADALRDVLVKGENVIEVRVANLWVNRIVGDEQPGAQRYTFTPIKFYSADSPLMESGLLGPVRLLRLD